MAREQLKNLTEPMYYILLSLLKENHGYGIMQMVDELTEGRVVIGAGTLYTLLGRFEKEEIIKQVAEENRRKIYIITEKGKGLLGEEFQRLNHLVEDGRKFFEFEGERKEPPAGGGSNEQEEPAKVSVTTTTFEQQTSADTKDDKPVRMPNRGWQLGGAF